MALKTQLHKMRFKKNTIEIKYKIAAFLTKIEIETDKHLPQQFSDKIKLH